MNKASLWLALERKLYELHVGNGFGGRDDD